MNICKEEKYTSINVPLGRKNCRPNTMIHWMNQFKVKLTCFVMKVVTYMTLVKMVVKMEKKEIGTKKSQKKWKKLVKKLKICSIKQMSWVLSILKKLVKSWERMQMLKEQSLLKKNLILSNFWKQSKNIILKPASNFWRLVYFSSTVKLFMLYGACFILVVELEIAKIL